MDDTRGPAIRTDQELEGPSPAGVAGPDTGRSRRRRRPSGSPPPLPYRLQTSGIGWLVAAVVLVGLALAVFARGLRGAAVAVTVADDTIVRWLAGLETPGLQALLRGLALSPPGGRCSRCGWGCWWRCWSCGAGGT